jgi:tripartite-type tricarboxylate transporter receptor subunit TctC
MIAISFGKSARVLALAGAAALAPLPVSAADFYAGKTINFIVGTDVGGGFSIYGRMIGRLLGKHIPGHPTVVVKNIPGAGGSVALSYMYNMAPKDGTTIATVPPNAVLGKLLDKSRGNYEPTKFNYLAGAERGTRLCMTFGHSKVKTFDDALVHEAVIGVTSAGSPTTQYAALHRNAAGAKFKLVSGYKGPSSLYLAMSRGEIDGACGLDWLALKSQQPGWLREKKLNLLVQDSIEPQPELAALGVPTPWRYIKNDVDRKAAKLLVGFEQSFGKAYFAPPGLPKERVQTLRDAFAAVLKDPELLADAKKLRVEIMLQSGDDIQRAVDNAFSSKADVVERLKKIVQP